MPRLFIGNFSFEHLRDRKDQLRKHLRRFEAEMSFVWLAVANDGDFIQCEEEVPASYVVRMKSLGCADVTFVTPKQAQGLSVDEVTCWGWTLPLRKMWGGHHSGNFLPNQELIWKINSRSYSLEMEAELGCGCVDTCAVKSIEDATAGVEMMQRSQRSRKDWLIKPEHSQSGRGQILIGPHDPDFARILNVNLSHGPFVIEPFLNKAREVGCQWKTFPDGTIEYLGAVELFSSDRGAYIGSETGITPMNFTGLSHILEVQRTALERIAGEGYFGPIGIDAMLYHDESGQLRTRPLQDINARWTMGRIALGWEKVFGKSGRFMKSKTPPNDAAIRLSPEKLGGTAVWHQMWWEPHS